MKTEGVMRNSTCQYMIRIKSIKYKDIMSLTFFSEMNHRVIFQNPCTSMDEYGGHHKTWQNYITVWAKVTPLKIQPHLSYYYDADNIVYQIYIRYLPKLHLGMRILYKKQPLDIKHLINIDEKNKYCQITAMQKIERKWK